MARGAAAQGAFWGDDCIIHNVALKVTTSARALTYAEVLELSRADLFDVLEAYPREHARVRKAHLRLVALRGVVHASALVAQAERDGMSCHTSRPPSFTSEPWIASLLEVRYGRAERAVRARDRRPCRRATQRATQRATV